MPQYGWQADSPFMGDYFCRIPRTNLAFVVVSKNASTFLKRVSILHATGEWNTDLRSTHAMVGRDGGSNYLVPVREMTTWERRNGRLRKFAVWRDPIRRVESCYSMFCIDGIYLPHLAASALYADPSEEHFRKFIQFETSKPRGWIESHFKPQSHSYDATDVDDILEIQDVHNYLDHHGVSYIDEKSNSSNNSDYRIKDASWRDELRRIYAADYDIEITWRASSTNASR